MQEKLRAMHGGGGRGGGGKVPDGGEKMKKRASQRGGKQAEGEPFEPCGVKDADEAAKTKRTGDEAFIKGDNQAAIAAYDASLAADDTNAKVWANRAAAKLKLKDYEGALEDAKTAREIDPKYIKAYYREGCALTELGEYEDAAMAFFDGLQVEEGNKDLKRGFDAAIARGRAESLKAKGK